MGVSVVDRRSVIASPFLLPRALYVAPPHRRNIPPPPLSTRFSFLESLWAFRATLAWCLTRFNGTERERETEEELLSCWSWRNRGDPRLSSDSLRLEIPYNRLTLWQFWFDCDVAYIQWLHYQLQYGVSDIWGGGLGLVFVAFNVKNC